MDRRPANRLRQPPIVDLRSRNVEIACRSGLAVEGQKARRHRLDDRAQAETPRPPDPIMRRPCADREEKQVTHGTG